MGKDSKIEWTHHTFNPWRGCTKVSPGCANCYAEAQSKRNPAVLGMWGKQGSRVVASDDYWRQPLGWNHHAALAGERHRVFCASLADVFEGKDTMPPECWVDVQQARRRLFELITNTPSLDWLLLTKRPENIVGWLEDYRDDDHVAMNYWPWPNVWLGTSIEDQQRAEERIQHLLATPASMRFLSCEPLLGPLDLSPWLNRRKLPHPGRNPRIDWVIIGGESGSKARRFEIEWAEEIIGQCEQVGVPCFVKQMGAAPTACGERIQLGRKGDAIEDWPEHLQVRQFPQ